MMNALCMHWRARLARLTVVAVLAGSAASVWSAAGCSAPDSSARVDPVGPSLEQFAYVAPVLSKRCGSIDCHGSKFRNMRVYGYGGLRLDPAATPDFPTHVTAEEAKATYDAVISLEPEIMREVVQSGGAQPERLTFVRKGRGDEEHKGHRRVTPGDSSDRCITSWLMNNVDIAACESGGCFDATPSSDGGVEASASASPDGGAAVFPITQCP
jgi:hypothetical protein